MLGFDELARSKLTNPYTFKGTFQLNRNNQIIGFLNKREKLQDKRDIGPNTPLSAASTRARATIRGSGSGPACSAAARSSM